MNLNEFVRIVKMFYGLLRILINCNELSIHSGKQICEMLLVWNPLGFILQQPICLETMSRMKIERDWKSFKLKVESLNTFGRKSMTY